MRDIRRFTKARDASRASFQTRFDHRLGCYRLGACYIHCYRNLPEFGRFAKSPAHSPLIAIDIITTRMPSRTMSSPVDDGQSDRRRFPGIPPGIRAVPTVQRVPSGIPPASDFRSVPRSGYRPDEERQRDHLQRAFPSLSWVDESLMRTGLIIKPRLSFTCHDYSKQSCTFRDHVRFISSASCARISSCVTMMTLRDRITMHERNQVFSRLCFTKHMKHRCSFPNGSCILKLGLAYEFSSIERNLYITTTNKKNNRIFSSNQRLQTFALFLFQ